MRKIILSLLATLMVYAALIEDDYPNTPSDAGFILLNTELRGNLETSNDEDWFKFTVDTLDGFEFILKGNEDSGQNTEGWSAYPLALMTEEEAFKTYPNTLIDAFYVSYDPNYPEKYTLNLEPGIYYIKVSTFDGVSGYSFQVNSDYNDGEGWIPDPTTIIYCKENPTECGIKPIVVVIRL